MSRRECSDVSLSNKKNLLIMAFTPSSWSAGRQTIASLPLQAEGRPNTEHSSNASLVNTCRTINLARALVVLMLEFLFTSFTIFSGMKTSWS